MKQETMYAQKSVLLIEDDELDVISLQRTIQKLELSVTLETAYNGIEALILLENRHNPLPDIILLDLNMPRMNGIEFLEELRKEERYRSIQVYVMTTSSNDSDRREVEALGVSGYIIKPLNFNDNSKKASSMDAFMQFHLLKILSL